MGSRRVSTRVAERRELILAEVLSGNGQVSELAERFNVSPATIRRDLHRMMADGRVTRTYGGAVARPRAIELSLHEKELSYRRQKDAIARLAAELVADGETLILDAGTTTGRLAWYLRQRKGLTVVTNGISALLSLRDADDVKVILLGGELRHVNQAVIGSIAEDIIRSLHADRAFLGADGVVANEGINSPTMTQAYLKGLMLRQAREGYVLADHSKLGTARFPYVTPFSKPVTLITDSQADPERVAAFENAGVRVLIAEVGRRNQGD